MDYKVHVILQARILEWLPFPSPGDLPNSGIEPRSPDCRQILHQLSYKGSPRILEWVTYPFSSRSSDPGIELGSPALQADSLPTTLGVYQRIDFKEPRLLDFPIPGKVLSSLT